LFELRENPVSSKDKTHYEKKWKETVHEKQTSEQADQEIKLLNNC